MRIFLLQGRPRPVQAHRPFLSVLPYNFRLGRYR